MERKICKHLNIAIDGPSGSGKSTLAKGLASKLGLVYIDTGAIYRTVGLYVQRKDLESTDKDGIVACLPEIDITMKLENGGSVVYLNGERMGDEIRTPRSSIYASDVSKLPEVRAHVLSLQRDIARDNDCIMDGRDIGTVVLPDAKIKIFLTASAEARAERRYKELAEKGQSVDFNALLEEIKQRDYQDSHREIAPLKQAEDAILVDTTNVGLEDAINLVLTTVKERL